MRLIGRQYATSAQARSNAFNYMQKFEYVYLRGKAGIEALFAAFTGGSGNLANSGAVPPILAYYLVGRMADKKNGQEILPADSAVAKGGNGCGPRAANGRPGSRLAGRPGV